jgi:parvulin-like peptidyl-prolyl isomerase
MKRLKFLAGLLLPGLLTGFFAQAQSSSTDKLRELFGNETIARGKGFEIKQGRLDESVITIRAGAASRGNAMPPDAVRRLEREVLKRLINIELLKQRATDEDRQKGEVEAQKRLDQLIERAGSEEAMARQLKAVDLTIERLRAKLIEEATAEMVLQREMNIQISDEEVKKFYDENPARFEQPEKVRAAHILLATRDPDTRREFSDAEKAAQLRKMEGLLERARRGEDFAAMAREYSEDRGSKDKGGEYTFPRGQMVPEFEAAAFSLPPGKVSDIVTTAFGYHIIKGYEKIPASVLPLDDKVREEVRDALKAQRLAAEMDAHMKILAEAAGVEILDERYKPIDWETKTNAE